MRKFNTFVLIVFAFTLVSLGTIYYFYSKTALPSDTSTDIDYGNDLTPTPTYPKDPNWKPPSTWSTFTSANGISFSKPDSENVTVIDGEIITLTLFGPSQREEGDFYDGITINVEKREFPQDDFKSAVDKIYVSRKNDLSKGEISALTPIVINGMAGFSFSENTSKIHTRIYITDGRGQYVNITSSFKDPFGHGFEEISNRIINSIVM